MILCPVACKVRDVKTLLTLKEDDEPTVDLKLVIQPISTQLQQFAFVIPASAEDLVSHTKDVSLETLAILGNSRKVLISFSLPLDAGRQREVSLSYRWKGGAKSETDQHDKVCRLTADFDFYGTSISSSFLNNLNEPTIIDSLQIQVFPPSGFEMEATPNWHSPQDRFVVQESAEWYFYDVGTHNPVHIRMLAAKIGEKTRSGEDTPDCQNRNHKLKFEVQQLKIRLGQLQEEKNQLSRSLDEKKQNLKHLQKQHSNMRKRKRLAYIIGGCMSAILIACILLAILVLDPDIIRKVLPITPTPTPTTIPTSSLQYLLDQVRFRFTLL
jgi:hypothetical protein